MKNFILIAAAAALLVSCATANLTTASLVTTASSEKMNQTVWVSPVCADLQVSANKISYVMKVSKSVAEGGYDSAVNTAIKEALEQNGNADVLVGLQTQVKYTSDYELESICVSGYPAKYVNFRSVTDSTTYNLFRKMRQDMVITPSVHVTEYKQK